MLKAKDNNEQSISNSTDHQPIQGDMMINDLVEKHPEVVDVLVYDYGFHCVGCFISEFETLEEGAMVHGITGDDYQKLLNELNQKVLNG